MGNTISSSEDNENEEKIFFNKLFQVSNVTLKDFKILKLIGAGTYGKVFQAKFKYTNTIFALKVLQKSDVLKSNTIERVFEERKILMELNSPFVVKLAYAFQTKTKLFFAMQYFKGGELFFHLKKEYQFSPSRSRIYLAQILFGLDALHEKGVMYRDLKPENILVGSDGYIALADFGLSKFGNQSFTVCGTHEYLAPEIVRHDSYDRRADFWSVGICLYEFLTGRTPFYDNNVNGMYEKILHSCPYYPAYFDDVTVDLLRKLLVKDSNKRIGGFNGVKEILHHPYFRGIDLEKLKQKNMKMSFVPFTKNAEDVSNFDKNFTKNQNSLTNSSETISNCSTDEFKDFSYVGDHNLSSIVNF
eukprot:TRINITY_DN883_c0_g1_i1.p1 TRINITY_DN883_c0_g1~~TRINITY_DN883_c0_g1_i1.p1  ORF type:complete len:380 (-),score=101.51 TRINITY_DN883_c0_g1_i1:129-1205(-)